MNRKISLGLALSLIIITAAASFAVTMAYSQKIYNKIIPGLSNRIERISELQDIESQINSKYYAVNDIDDEALNTSVAKAFLEGLGSDGDRYLTAQEYKDYLNVIECKTRGIGVITTQKAGTASLYVFYVAPGSPAAKEGIVSGDEIIKIDDQDVLPDHHKATDAKLQGMSLKTVALTYRRNSEVFTANVLFGFDEQSVAYSVIGTIGYIKIVSFYKNTPAQLENAIKELTSKGVSGIVFDVRGTDEGTIEYAAKTVDILVPTATIKDSSLARAVVDWNNTEYARFASDAKELALPMTVLIDEKTSGGAELFALSLIDFKDSATFGAKTAGHDKLIELIPLESGSAMLLTVARIEAYKTKNYGDGIVPLVPVTLTDEQAAAVGAQKIEEDPVFAEASSYMLRGQ